MAIIKVEDIRVYAYHGCMDEEGVVGGNYRVDVWVEANTDDAELSDDLKQTVDYVLIHDIVKREMAIRSKLIEHVGRRIADAIKASAKNIYIGEITVAKLNPPINGVVGTVSVTIGI